MMIVKKKYVDVTMEDWLKLNNDYIEAIEALHDVKKDLEGHDYFKNTYKRVLKALG